MHDKILCPIKIEHGFCDLAQTCIISSRARYSPEFPKFEHQKLLRALVPIFLLRYMETVMLGENNVGS